MKLTLIVLVFFLCILFCHGQLINDQNLEIFNHINSKFSKKYRPKNFGYKKNHGYFHIKAPNINQQRIKFGNDMKND